MHKSHLNKVRNAHKSILKNYKMYVFDKAHMFIDQKIEKIMQKTSEAFDDLSNQYSTLRDVTLEKENKLKRVASVVVAQEQMILQLRMYVVKLIQRHGLNSELHRPIDLSVIESDLPEYVEKAGDILQFEKFSFYNSTVKLDSTDKLEVIEHKTVSRLLQTKKQMTVDIEKMLAEVRNAKDI